MSYLPAKYYRLSLLLFLGFIFTACGEDFKQENEKLQKQVDHLSMEVQKLRLENARLRELSGDRLQIGFEVQIGAFEHFDLSAYSDELMRFSEQKDNGVNKYVLGQFSRFENAEDFLRDIKKMGIRDAFIAGIVDGQRSTVRSAKVAAKEYYGN